MPQKSPAQYRALLRQMVNGFALFEILTDRFSKPYDCRLIEVNSTFETMTGLKAGQVVGHTLCQFLPEADPDWIDACARIASTRRPMQFKTYFKKIDRELEIHAFSPCKGYLAAVLTDTTAGLRLEQALRASEHNFRAVAENAHDGILITTSFQGPCVYANRRAGVITGFAVPELLQIGPPKLIPAEEFPRIKRIVERRLLGKDLPDRCESRILNRDGSGVTVEVCGSSTVWQGRKAALLFLRDISLRKVVQAEVAKINRELERRVEERTRELSDIAVKLERRQWDIMRHKADLERANKELVQTNTALSVLARNIDRKCEDYEKKIARAVSVQMMPLIDEIRRDRIPGKSLSKLEALAAYLNSLTPGISKSREVIVALSGMELRVAVMIKKGFRTDAIGRILHISPHTVKTHRRNIRKKLKLQNSQINLSSFLKHKLDREPLNG